MLLIDGNKIKKYYNDRLIFNVDSLKIYSGDRIGIVGENGVGKTTLMNILSQKLEPTEGFIKSYGSMEYISQLESPDYKKITVKMADHFGIKTTWDENMSGGEKTRFKLAAAFSNESSILFADEPTSNLDIDGIEILEELFSEYGGALVLISHDRSFLNKLCNKIIEIENSKIKLYNGNYNDYKELKMKERDRAIFEFEKYEAEKKRLKGVMNDTKQKTRSIKKAPKRMGNSEARLHKMGGQKAKKNLEKKVKNIQKRIEHLEVKEKPRQESKIKLDVMNSSELHSKIVIQGKRIVKKFDEKIIFKNAEFNIYNGDKVALIGPNGCGKTTLLQLIMNSDSSIRIAQSAKIGYFRQDMNILKSNLSIIDNVMESSIYPEKDVRLLLARLLFKGDTIYKNVDVLSGGELVKVSFAKILLQDTNVLILDEPTNYLDINSMEVLEDALKSYDKTLLFVSHDRQFNIEVANKIMSIEKYKIKVFPGTYLEFLEKKKSSKKNEEIQKRIILLENRLSEVIGKLSMQLKKENLEALDKEYYEIIEELKQLRDK